MKKELNLVRIDRYSAFPMYKQLMVIVLEAITEGEIEQGELLPSLHEHSSALEVSRNTVEKAYRALKAQGILGSFKGKGYYLRKVEPLEVQRRFRALTQELG